MWESEHCLLEDRHVQISGTWKYVILQGDADVAGLIRSGTPRWEGFPGLPGGPNVITKVLVRGRQEVREEGRCYPPGFENGRTGREPRNADDFWKLAKSRKQIPQEECVHVDSRLLTSRTVKEQMYVG